MLSHSELKETSPATEGDVTLSIVSLSQASEVVVIPAEIHTEAAQINKLVREKALEKIKNDLQAFKKNKIIRQVLANLSTIQLNYAEGDKEASSKINQYLRQDLLKILPLNPENFGQIHLHKTVLHSLLLLANYWPLNDYELNETETEGNFVCPWTQEILSANNRILFVTGAQIHASCYKRYYDFSLANNFKDPLSQNSLPALGVMNFIAKDPAFASAYLNSPEYNAEKEFEIVRRTIKWGAIGSYIPIIIVAALVITSLLVAIPPLAVFITGLSLCMGSILTRKLGTFLGRKSKERQYESFENEMRTNALVDHNEINLSIESINRAAKSDVATPSMQDVILNNEVNPALPVQTVSNVVLLNSTSTMLESLDAKDEGANLKEEPDLDELAKTYTPKEMAVWCAQKRFSLFKKSHVQQVQPLSTPTSHTRFTA